MSHIGSDSNFVRHLPCEVCGSSDANSLYDDGHTYCFGCNTHRNVDEAEDPSVKPKSNTHGLLSGVTQALTKRSLNENTCSLWGYRVGNWADGTPVQIADYRDEAGTLVAQKVRFPNKDFKFIGDTKAAGLYGQHLWRDGGKMIVVTEGEIDALSVSQAQGNKWPVVSVPNGAQGAKKSIQKSLEWLSKFETVVFMFDMDDVGRKAAAECAELLKPSQAKIASLPLKDANEMLVAGRVKEIIDAIWGAKTFRPDGILSGADLWEEVAHEEAIPSISYPWQALNEKTHGMRRGELVTLTAGSGVGKSAVVRELASYLLKQGETVGMLMLEENPKRTALGLMGIEVNKPLHLSREGVTEDELKRAFEATVGSGNCFLYDHWGSSDIENLVSRIRYMAKGLGCSWIILDHLSIVVSGLGDGDERRLIDNAMTYLRTLVEETGVGLFLVSHLKRPEGNRGHEEGATTSLSQLRGSHAIAQLSDLVVGLERNQQGDDPNLTTLRVLKNRYSGEVGLAGYLRYSRDTGRLSEVDQTFEDEKVDF